MLCLTLALLLALLADAYWDVIAWGDGALQKPISVEVKDCSMRLGDGTAVHCGSHMATALGQSSLRRADLSARFPALASARHVIAVFGVDAHRLNTWRQYMTVAREEGKEIWFLGEMFPYFASELPRVSRAA